MSVPHKHEDDITELLKCLKERYKNAQNSDVTDVYSWDSAPYTYILLLSKDMYDNDNIINESPTMCLNPASGMTVRVMTKMMTMMKRMKKMMKMKKKRRGLEVLQGRPSHRVVLVQMPHRRKRWGKERVRGRSRSRTASHQFQYL